MSDTKFIPGLIIKAPNERAPEYVKAKLSFKNAELIVFLQAQIAAGEEWTNADIKVSAAGKWYAQQDEWKPNGNTSSSGPRGGAPARERPAPVTAAASDDFVSDDIPFATNRSTF